jgi:hypothetical protein
MPTKRRRRDSFKEGLWRGIIRRHQNCGLSVRDFCEREGLKGFNFLRWRRELTGTCKHHGIDPFAYLRDVLRRLPSMSPEQLDELLPDVWFESHPSARRKTAA